MPAYEDLHNEVVSFFISRFGVDKDVFAHLTFIERGTDEIWATSAPTPLGIAESRPAGVRALRRQGVEHNVLVTLNASNVHLGVDLYEFFLARGVRYLQFIPILERDEQGDPLPFSCPPQAYGAFLTQVFDRWYSRHVGKVSLRLFDSLIHQAIFGQASTCTFAPRCANAFVLEWNGDLYACDHFVYPRWRLGNILQTPQALLARSPLLERFAALKTDPPAACTTCRWWDWCHGGCPKHHRPLYGGPTREPWFCEAYRTFLPHAMPRLERLAERIGARQPTHGAKAHPGERRGASHRRPVRRNDPCPCGSGRKYKHCCGKG